MKILSSIENLKRTDSSIIWSILADVSQRFIPALFLLSYVYLLPPSSFGALFLINMVISLGNVVFSFGLRHGYLHKSVIEESFEKGFNSLAWILGGFSTCLLVIAAPWLAKLFNQTELSYPIRIASIQLLLLNIALVQFSFLEKKRGYRLIFLIRTVSVVLGGLVGFLLIHLGFDYLGIIYGSIAGQILPIVLLFSTKPVWPSFSIGEEWLVHLKNFSGWVAANDFISWFYSWIDILILNALMGVEFSGLYRVAHQVAGLLFVAPSMAIANYGFNMLSRVKDHAAVFVSTLKQFLVFATVFFSAMLFLLISNIEGLKKIIPAQWSSLDVSVIVLAVLHILFGLVMISSYAIRSSGRALLEAKLSFLLIPFFFAASWSGAKMGFSEFLYIKLFVAIVFLSVYFVVLHRIQMITTQSIVLWILNPVLVSIVFLGLAWIILYQQTLMLKMIISPIVALCYLLGMMTIHKLKMVIN
jgi:hypothetical protein